MKKFKYAVLSAAVLLSACHHNEVYYDESVIAVEETAVETTGGEVVATAAPAATGQPAVTTGKPAAEPKQVREEVEVMNPDQPVEKLAYDSAYDRFLDNVVIKARSYNYVTYEYKDVRVDELAPLASRYCEEHGNRTAVLRSVILYKNYARRATFACLRLQ